MTRTADQGPAPGSGEFTPETELLYKIPIGYARRHLLLPCRGPEGELVLLAGDPGDSFAIDETRFLVGPARVVEMPGDAIRNMIDSAYERVQTPEREIVEGLSGEWELDVEAAIEETRDLLESPDEGPVIKFVHSLIFRAIRERSSDIHIEPFEKELLIRNRIDGVLYPMVTAPRKWHAPVVSRIKVMAGLDIAERRLPQDGRIRIRVGGNEIDIRVSVVPTAYGERAVLRILDRSSLLLGLEDIGLDPADLAVVLRLLARSNGILLVTGPTGSGKTTTLYGALRRLDSGTKNIITIEDPIEYQIRGIGQIQVNPKIQLTFASGLRSILRQDPDIIMVGEIRDPETAEIAIQASLTGHLVLSTLHTNDSSSAVTRLVDMGIEPFLVASSLTAVIAQRLVRRLCSNCRTPYSPTEEQWREIGLPGTPSGTFYRSAG
ncbi:MAG TPA: ATPase, T2SS/T4P/T4SS family, partial [Candidatus Deferrimicrobiaceae bacterium]